MKPTHSTWGVLGATFLYLHDERVEVGRVQVGFIEELDRMSYRDVRVLRSWRTGRPFLKLAGAVVALLGVFSAAVVVISGIAAFVAAITVLVPLPVAGALWWAGRDGSLLVLRLEDGHRELEFGLGGRARAQERAYFELVKRIREVRSSTGS